MSIGQCISIAIMHSRALFAHIVAAFVVLVVFLRLLLGDMPSLGNASGGVGASTSRMADMLAYNIIALGFAMYCGINGMVAWFNGAAGSMNISAAHRLYSYLAPAEKLCIMTTAYETFNCAATIVLPEYRTPAFIGHHVTTLVLGVIGFHPFCHYYVCPHTHSMNS